jgi:hypothetical protein
MTASPGFFFKCSIIVARISIVLLQPRSVCVFVVYLKTKQKVAADGPAIGWRVMFFHGQW